MSCFQRVEPQQSPIKYVEKAIGAPPISADTEKSVENGRVSSIVNAINNNSNSVRGRVSKSSSKDDLKDQSLDSALQDALNSSTGSVSLIRNVVHILL